MNLLLCFFAWWAYQNFGLLGVLMFPTMMMAMLYFRQNTMLYVNTMKSYQAQPPRFNMPDYEEVWLTTRDGVRIFAWLIRGPRPAEAPTMMFFHGNAGTIAERLPNAEGLIKHTGCNLLLVEYRGYGTSGGDPTEAGLLADGQAALDHLRGRKDIDTDNLLVFGRSLGGAVAIALAHANEGALRGMIVENTFTSIREMAGALFPFLAVLPDAWFEALLDNHWHSDEIIGALRLPSLFLAGKQDEIVPPPQMVELWDRLRGAGEPPQHSAFVPFPAGKHNDTWTLPGYYAPIARFLRAAAKPGTAKGGGATEPPEKEPEEEKREETDHDGWTRMSAEGEEGDTTPSPLKILSDAAIGDMSVQQLRSSLAKRKVAHGHCVEKAELVELLRDTQSRLS